MARKSDAPNQRSIRWWPAVVLVLAGIAALLLVWTRDTGNTQQKVIPTFAILFFFTLGLFGWLVFFSRLARRTRWAIFSGVAVFAGLGLLVLEIKAVDGNLVPIVGFRWAGEREFGTSIAPTAAVATSRGANDYSQFYGPGRSAMLPGPPLARDWNARPPRELWRRETGYGLGSFAVVADAAVTFEQRGDDEVVVRHDLQTGEQIWTHAYHAPFNTTIGGRGPRATPTLDDGRVYTFGASGDLSCLDLETGTEIWSRNVLADHDTERPDWGMPSSPLVIDDLVLVQLGNRGRGLAAYDRVDGEPVWRKGDDRGTYTSPMPATLLGQPQVLVVYRESVAAHDPRDPVATRLAEPGHRAHHDAAGHR